MRKTFLILLGAIAGAGLTLLATQPHNVFVESSAKAASSDTYRQLNLFGDVFERVRADYVEKPDDNKLVESAINGMLAGLDPHSSYMDPKSFRDIQVQTRGEFGGLGIEVTMEDGLVKVVAPIDDTPAAKAGVMANDMIIKLDDDFEPTLSLHSRADGSRHGTTSVLEHSATLFVASKGGDDRDPQWYGNLTAHPDIEITMEGTTRPMRARTATAEEKATLWPQIVSAYKGYGGYQKKTSRDIPVVICEPRPG